LLHGSRHPSRRPPAGQISRCSSSHECLLITLLDGFSTGLGVNLRGLRVYMSQDLLDLLQRHAAVQERLRHRMAEEVEIHPLSDLGLGRRLFHNPLDAAQRVALVVRRLKEMTGAAGAQVGFELLGQLEEDRHVAALAAFSLGNQDHLLVKEKILGRASARTQRASLAT
jgi:hypothetical protein